MSFAGRRGRRGTAPVAILAASLAAPACEVPPTSPYLDSAFVAAHYAPYARPGTGRIQGRVVTPRPGLGPGARDEPEHGWLVGLHPATPHAVDWAERAILDGVVHAQLDVGAHAYTRFAWTDLGGAFTFEELPAGRYVLWAPEGVDRPADEPLPETRTHLTWCDVSPGRTANAELVPGR